MKVLFATSELADFAKAGGLGDVSASLPRALKRRGADVRVVLPAYPELLSKAAGVSIVSDLPGRADIPSCRIAETRTPDGLILYLVLAPSLYERGGSPYCDPRGVDWADNDLRFARLSLAAAQLAAGRAGLSWVPDVLHANDWPGGLAPAYLCWDEATVRTILTIHNIAYQGIFEKERLHRLGIPESAFDMYGVEFHDRLSFLKAGIFYADQVVAVSPSYAREVTTKALGAGLYGLMRTLAVEGRLSGILNGIDGSWDPERDPYLPRHFTVQDLSGKQAMTDLVRTALCLTPSDGPLFGVVSRLVHQKGLDVVAEVADAVVKEGGQIAILGLGDPETEHLLGRVARGRRDHVALLNGFNEAMARRIVAASHFLLMPSRFEPCGLVQMQAQRYGSLPIAHATGGLADTVEDGKTGFLFSDFSASGLYGACRRAFEAYADQAVLRSMREAAMSRRFDWSAAAEQYEALYCRSLELPRALRSRPSARCAGCTNEGAIRSPGERTTQGAVERYLEKLHETRDVEERDHLHHLVVEAESRMGVSRERFENGEGQVVEGRHRIEKQRALVAQLPIERRAISPATQLLQRLERTQLLLEAHLEGLDERRERARL